MNNADNKKKAEKKSKSNSKKPVELSNGAPIIILSVAGVVVLFLVIVYLSFFAPKQDTTSSVISSDVSSSEPVTTTGFESVDFSYEGFSKATLGLNLDEIADVYGKSPEFTETVTGDLDPKATYVYYTKNATGGYNEVYQLSFDTDKKLVHNFYINNPVLEKADDLSGVDFTVIKKGVKPEEVSGLLGKDLAGAKTYYDADKKTVLELYFGGDGKANPKKIVSFLDGKFVSVEDFKG